MGEGGGGITVIYVLCFFLQFYLESIIYIVFRPCFTPQVLMYMDCLHGKWPLDAIKAVFSRRYLLQNCAVEVYTSTGSEYFVMRPI